MDCGGRRSATPQSKRCAEEGRAAEVAKRFGAVCPRFGGSRQKGRLELMFA